MAASEVHHGDADGKRHAVRRRGLRRRLRHREGNRRRHEPACHICALFGIRWGLFQADRVTVTARDGFQYHRDNPRAACLELAPEASWDVLHLLYFTGYALWNYLCAPFLLAGPGFAAEEIAPWTEDGQIWRRLLVYLPADVPTHSTEQVFYFDDAGLLRRLDYVPEILGGSGHAAHYCLDRRDFSGLIVPVRRRVYGRREHNIPDTKCTFVEIGISALSLSGAPLHEIQEAL